ncbi:MAG: 2-oxoglutarate dehydrogenase complex dihydrolipoyllysine-residue succinyltransferase [Deltaproteobacteria bacterium]|nr:2-oxoglutarate dehydrogenase complex dihydrolipoyllysine-residue succinyltransferase [Deltaproteobacteria bacterium]
MSNQVEIKVPVVGESITEVVVSQWLKTPGSPVALDEGVVSLETDKVNVDVPAPVAGVLTKILKNNGESARVGEVIGYLTPGEVRAEAVEEPRVMPAAQRILAQAGLAPSAAIATGPGGRLLKEDALAAVGKLSDGQKIPLVFAEAEPTAAPPVPARAAIVQPPVPAAVPAPVAPTAPAVPPSPDARVELVPMSPMRRRIAQRLVEAQQTAAILTTFNEVDMSAVQDLRKRWQEAFVQKHGVKLGFMSFFVRASVDALKAFPLVNAQIRGDQIAMQHFYDIGVAIGGGKGLVVPVLRDADSLSLAEIEKKLADFAAKAKAGTLKLEELQGGTFSITNGGVYGSMMSTPLLNPPQSAILGMHNIIERPVGVAGQVVLRPMMYLALSYDHRLIDGREAVQFLVRIKQTLEAPERLLLEL